MRRKSFAWVTALVSGFIALTIATAGPAFAWSTTPFGPLFSRDVCAFSAGHFTWFNRSANVTGRLVDLCPGRTAFVVFEFFGPGGHFVGEAVRKHVGQGRTYFDFTFHANWVHGGVRRIEFCVLTNVRHDAACASRHRP